MVVAYPDLEAHHFRPTSSAGGRLKGLFRLGKMDGAFGSHPVFEVLKCARRAAEHPLVLGSIVRFAGYVSCCVTMRAPLLPAELVAYLRDEQLVKIYHFLPHRGAVERFKSKQRNLPVDEPSDHPAA
jgi:hypothetical protein